MNRISTRNLGSPSCLTLALFAMRLAAPHALLAQAPALEPDGRTINAPRPVMDLALLLEERYRKPVTYEDPVWQWRGDSFVAGRDENALALRWQSFLLPDGLTPAESSALDETLVAKALDAYHSQNPDSTQFRVTTSRLGLHIVPAKLHDAWGRVVTAGSLLDAYIRVPEARRMATDHLTALRDAVTAATGTKVEESGNDKWLDQFYAAGGLVPPRSATKLLTTEEQQPYSFVWGAGVMTARDALLSLLDSSATTLTWRVLCEPSASPGDRFCVLNVVPIQVPVIAADGKPELNALGRPKMRSLSYDRLKEPPKTIPRPAPHE